MKKHIIALVILGIGSAQFAQAQIKRSELNLFIGPTATKIKNKSIAEDEQKLVINKNGLNAELTYNRYRNGLGIGIGLGYSNFKQDILLKGNFENLSQKDEDGNLYDEWYDCDITYTNTLHYITVPVTMHLVFGRAETFNFVMDFGIVNQFLGGGNSTMKGSIENMGRYETSNPYFFILSQENSYYDYKLRSYDEKSSDQYRKYALAGHVSMGLTAKMTKNVVLKAQPFLDFGLMDITAKEFQDVEYTNLFGRKSDYQKTKLSAMGLNIGISYNIGNMGVE